VKVVISAESDVDELEANGNNLLKPDKKPHIPATKSIRSKKAIKIDHGKKPATKAPPTPQYSNEAMGNSRSLDRARKPFVEWWENHILPPQDKEHANIATIGEPRNLREAIELSDANEWELAMEEEYEFFIAIGTWELSPLPQGRKVQMGVSYKEGRKRHGRSFQSKIRSKGMLASGRC
jgi:hypothetical protein